MARRLNDMVVVITGASAGIGKALAERLSARGARLVLAARRVQRLEKLNREMSARHLVLGADVAQRDDCEMIIRRTIEHFARIDTLVCNAGYGIYRPMSETTPEEMRQIFDTNLFGTTDCIHAVLPHMLNQEPLDDWRGQIMIVSSAVARRAVPYMSAYSATKAAQLSIAEALRVEMMPHRIAVTTVHPIQTRTEFGRRAAALGGLRIAGSPVGQDLQTVVRRMVDAVVAPRAELWPHRPSRWALGVGTLFPRTVDWFMNDYRKQVAELNGRRVSDSTAAEG